MKQERPVVDKAANALLPQARAAGWITPLTADAVGRVGAADGGLWVGGRVRAYRDRVEFRPNAVNRVAHRRGTLPEAVVVPLLPGTQVEVRPGFVTRIVACSYGEWWLVARMFGADGVAATLRELAGGPPAG